MNKNSESLHQQTAYSFTRSPSGFRVSALLFNCVLESWIFLANNLIYFIHFEHQHHHFSPLSLQLNIGLLSPNRRSFTAQYCLASSGFLYEFLIVIHTVIHRYLDYYWVQQGYFQQIFFSKKFYKIATCVVPTLPHSETLNKLRKLANFYRSVLFHRFSLFARRKQCFLFFFSPPLFSEYAQVFFLLRSYLGSETVYPFSEVPFEAIFL